MKQENCLTSDLHKKIEMSLYAITRRCLFFIVMTLASATVFAQEDSYREARDLQHAGKYDEAVEAYRNCLLQPVEETSLSKQQLSIYTDALVQMMNTFQSKGDPEGCVLALQEIFQVSHILQSQCLRDYYSVLGYALSRTENMRAAEESILQALSLPLESASPERYFRDYAYAAAVFYSNPDYHDKVILWCREALTQAQLCENSSGSQWVTAMLGSLYKRSGNLHEALELFQQSIEESRRRNDDLGVLNGLHSLVDLFLYWDVPEYADKYATEALTVQEAVQGANPMVTAQTFINKARALHRLGKTDSISIYIDKARALCESLPYNGGMVDVDLLDGICMTERGGEVLHAGISHLQDVAIRGTEANKAKAFHQLAQTYIRLHDGASAEIMLDSLYKALSHSSLPINIVHLDYEPILEYYLSVGDNDMYKKYVQLLFQEHKMFRENRINVNLVESIVDFQTRERLHQISISQLEQANQRLWLMVFLTVSIIVFLGVVAVLLSQKRRYMSQIKEADQKLDNLVQKLNESSAEKERIAQEVIDFLNNKDKRLELETLTPHVLKDSGEVKFRQCFELLYPLFLHRLRERVPAVTPREELLSMLIVLKQDNKEIAELLAVAPRSVLMLRHRFRQKIGLTTECSLENFIDSLLD